MNYDVTFTDAAQQDLNDIFDYISIALSSPKAAKDWLLKVDGVVTQLSEFPEAFALCLEEPWVLRAIRVMPVGNYKFFYHVKHDVNQVVILRILYFRQNANNDYLVG